LLQVDGTAIRILSERSTEIGFPFWNEREASVPAEINVMALNSRTYLECSNCRSSSGTGKSALTTDKVYPIRAFDEPLGRVIRNNNS